MARTDDSWIQTYTGRKFWPHDPEPDDIVIEDVAHALALANRYTGHTREPYSVAQHCVIMSWLCPDKKWALMHDAAEAYLSDVARPVKRYLQGYAEMEDRLLACVAGKFGLAMPIPDCVHEWDKIMLTAERRDLINHKGEDWFHIRGVTTLSYAIQAWPWSVAEKEFLHQFNKLWSNNVI